MKKRVYIKIDFKDNTPTIQNGFSFPLKTWWFWMVLVILIMSQLGTLG